MLHEFALDPAALTRWEPYRYLIEKFGIEHGRMISQFPKRWELAVFQALRNTNCPDVERKKIIEALTKVGPKLIDLSRAYDASLAWLPNAEAQHASVPFHAIITIPRENNPEYVRTIDELTEDDECMLVVREQAIPRNRQAMGACVARLLQASQEILFVDQNFNPDLARFRATLFEFISVATRNYTRQCHFEFHVGTKCPQADFVRAAKDYLLQRLPQAVIVTFVRWEQVSQGDHLHPRYILTDIGGVNVESGLDEGEPGETTDIRLLAKTLYTQRWNEYQQSAARTKGLSEKEKREFRPTFQLVDQIQVIGRKKVVVL